MASEKLYENRIKEFLTSTGCWFVKYWGGGLYTKSGVPDILANVNGYFVGIEVKAQNGKPSALQKVNLKKINKSNGYGILTYPSDFELLKDLITALNKNDLNKALEIKSIYERVLL